MKMYILIKDNVPDEFAPVIAAHASLACFRQFEADEDMQTWINDVFKKVVCRVNEKEFNRAGEEEKQIRLTESALDNQEVAMAFCPRDTYPKPFKFFKKWKPRAAKEG